jgi:hypothetical protein
MNFEKLKSNPNWDNRQSMLNSRKRFNLIARYRKIFKDHARDPIYWKYKDEVCKLDQYIDWVRYCGNKAFFATIRPNSGNPEVITIVNSDIFKLSLLGRIRQKKENGISKDYFLLPKYETR